MPPSHQCWTLHHHTCVQTLVERAVVLGLGAQVDAASPALSELLSQYAGILASQVHISSALPSGLTVRLIY